MSKAFTVEGIPMRIMTEGEREEYIQTQYEKARMLAIKSTKGIEKMDGNVAARLLPTKPEYKRSR